MEMEHRSFELTDVQVRDNSGGMPTLEGYAAIFDTLSEPLGGFREKIAPGAFAESINADDVRALWNHDPAKPLARNRAGNLTLSEDSHGLKIVMTPTDTSYARDMVKNIRGGVVNQMSFGFYTVADSWEKVDGEQIRTVTKAKLFDVSPVTYPAYTDTEISSRMSVFERARSAGRLTGCGGISMRKRQLDLLKMKGM